MNLYAEFFQNKYPIVTILFTGLKSTDENFGNYLNQLRALYDKKENIALIFNASNASIPSLAHQKLQANWLKENEALMVQYCKGTAYVISNVIIRGVLKTIFKFQKQPVPYTVVSTQKEAEVWVNEKLGLG